MITLDGDNIIETTEKLTSVKDLRARKKALNDEIDLVKLEPELVLMDSGRNQKLEMLKNEKDAINTLLGKVNLT